MPHLSELHGAATHLAVVAIPLFAILHFLRRADRGGPAVAGAEPWALGAALIGIAAAGATGLLVWGQAQTTLRGQHFRIGTAHFWLGIAVAVLAVAASADWYLTRRRDGARHRPAIVPIIAVLIVAGVVVQGYLGGRMTYDKGVGVFDGGELAQTARAPRRSTPRWPRARRPWSPARRRSRPWASAARAATATWRRAARARLQGGREVEDFRRVHGHGLFPAKAVSDRQFAAIDAWLRTLGGGREADGD